MLPKHRKPTHPGKILLEHFLMPMGILQSQFVKHLDGTWTLSKLNEIIHSKRGITEKTALDFSDALGTTPQFWLNLQNNYNLWVASQNHKKIRRIR
jgi:addiction module HigA family antidote